MNTDSSKEKGFKHYLRIVFDGILTGIGIIAVILLFIVGIEYHFGGAKVFDASASTEEGKRAISEFQIKYICSSVYGLEFSDFYRSGCQFATGIDRSKQDELKYQTIKEEYVSKFNLQPDFSWWDRNGMYVSLAVILLLIGFFILLHTDLL